MRPAVFTIYLTNSKLKYAHYDLYTVSYVEFSLSVSSLVVSKLPNPVEWNINQKTGQLRAVVVHKLCITPRFPNRNLTFKNGSLCL